MSAQEEFIEVWYHLSAFYLSHFVTFYIESYWNTFQEYTNVMTTLHKDQNKRFKIKSGALLVYRDLECNYLKGA